jgi:putative hydrolase of the HAD superfamily
MALDTEELFTTTAPPPQTVSASVRERFAHIDTWVFDLDNTLYPAGSPVWPAIDERITLYLAALFGLDGLSARGLQKYYYRRYGTTLRGLMEEHTISSEEFLRFVHDIDRTMLAANPDLSRALALLPGRKLILTNGSREHALRTTEQLGLGGAFEDVFDIVSAELVPKPDPSVYDRFLVRHGVDPARAVMFEDMTRNLVVPHERGMLTVLVVPKATELDHREPWEAEGASEAYVDFVTDDLAGFLKSLILTDLAGRPG